MVVSAIHGLPDALPACAKVTCRRYGRRVFCTLLLTVSLLFCLQADCSGQGAKNNETSQDQASSNVGDQALEIASRMRSAPITEPGIPVQQVRGIWKRNYLKLTEKDIVITYQLEPEFKFHVQAVICEPKGKKAIFSDATVLGDEESAATFYAANAFFYAPNTVDFISCMDEYAHLESKADPAASNSIVLYRSEERVLRHMSNWLLFLARFRKDPGRSTDFLPFILTKYKKLLIDADAERDIKEVAIKIKFFDRTFPLSVIDLGLPLSAEGRKQACDFFETLLFMRRKIKPLVHEQASLISRDEQLLKKLQ